MEYAKEPTDRGDVDPTEVLAALGVDDATTVAPITAGLATSLWRVECPHGVYALRVFGHEQSDICEREIISMRAAAEAGISVPRVHATGVCRGRSALLLSWCSGRPLLEELESRPWRLWSFAVAFGRMHGEINTIEEPRRLGPHPVSWIDWAGPGEEALRARLRELDESAPVLLHLDYHPLNVLWADGSITGVLDWTNVRVGDARADFARTYVYLRVVPPSADPPLWLTLGRRLFLKGWHHGYRQTARSMGDLTLFFAWAGVVAERDLEPKIGEPGSWLEPRHIDEIRRWTAGWKRRAGLA